MEALSFRVKSLAFSLRFDRSFEGANFLHVEHSSKTHRLSENGTHPIPGQASIHSSATKSYATLSAGPLTSIFAYDKEGPPQFFAESTLIAGLGSGIRRLNPLQVGLHCEQYPRARLRLRPITASIAKNAPSVVRNQLTDAETQQRSISRSPLKMRNFARVPRADHRIGRNHPARGNERKVFSPDPAAIENRRADG